MHSNKHLARIETKTLCENAAKFLRLLSIEKLIKTRFASTVALRVCIFLSFCLFLCRMLCGSFQIIYLYFGMWFRCVVVIKLFLFFFFFLSFSCRVIVFYFVIVILIFCLYCLYMYYVFGLSLWFKIYTRLTRTRFALHSAKTNFNRTHNVY